MKKIALLFTVLCTAGALNGMESRPVLNTGGGGWGGTPSSSDVYRWMDGSVADGRTANWSGILDTLYYLNDVNEYRAMDGTPLLFIAVLNEKYAEAETLLKEYKADPNMANLKGLTPLIVACSLRNIPLVKLLLEYGADPYQKDNSGKDSFGYTMAYVNRGNSEAVEILKLLNAFLKK